MSNKVNLLTLSCFFMILPYAAHSLISLRDFGKEHYFLQFSPTIEIVKSVNTLEEVNNKQYAPSIHEDIYIWLWSIYV